jgi:glycosyltransferase involved in cell wall biosynthesis
MIILLNALPLSAGGGLQVLSSFLSCALGNNHLKFIVAVDASILNGPALADIPEFSGDSVTFATFSCKFHKVKSLRSVVRHLSARRFLTALCKSLSPDVVLTLFGPAYWKPPSGIPHVCGFARPSLLYKESPYVQLLSKRKKTVFQLKNARLFLAFLLESDFLYAESEDVVARLKKIYPYKPVKFISNCLNQEMLRRADESIKLLRPYSSEVQSPHVVFVPCSSYPHKNLKTIPIIYHHYQKKSGKKLRFVFVCNASLSGLDSVDVDCWDYREHLFLGPLRPADMASWYEKCDVVLMPSLLECFSASYIEALLFEKPLVAAKISSMFSLLPHGPFWYDPVNAHDAAVCISEAVRCLRDPNSVLLRKLLSRELRTCYGSPDSRFFAIVDLCQLAVAVRQRVTSAD